MMAAEMFLHVSLVVTNLIFLRFYILKFAVIGRAAKKSAEIRTLLSRMLKNYRRIHWALGLL